MSGHSKWSKIKRKKGVADQRRGQLFSKMIREIMVAARLGGPNPDANIRLAAAIERARAESMPAEKIERAIRRGAGLEEGAVCEEAIYEGYGPGGTALLIEAQTENRNRATAAIRHILERHGGSLGASGCVAWLFKDRGLVVVEAGAQAEDRVIEAALEAGALDVTRTDDGYDVATEPAAVTKVAEALRRAGLKVASAEVTKTPETTVPLRGEEARALLRLIEALEAEEDVQRVHANFEIPDEELEAAASAG